tara:strand:+ start:1986 stop:2726 length:741 start_codon:yes stop_codon:yes gene_type:complete
MKLILLRHGESQWNLENKFTGWTDVSLTKKGEEEAKQAGQRIIQEGITVSSVYTSLLIRAIETTNIVCNEINFEHSRISYEWRLNERHYGALQGLNKSETATKYGEKQVKIWRRSYDIPPPKIDENDDRHPKKNKKFSNINNSLPNGESLKNVIERLEPFWEAYFSNIIKSNKNHLIVAHSNSLRAIIKILDNLSSEEIVSVNLPTGVPLIYEFDLNNLVISKQYLIDEDILFEKQKMIENQGKAN